MLRPQEEGRAKRACGQMQRRHTPLPPAECGVGGCKVPKAMSSGATSPGDLALFATARIAFVILSSASFPLFALPRHFAYETCWLALLIVSSLPVALPPSTSPPHPFRTLLSLPYQHLGALGQPLVAFELSFRICLAQLQAVSSGQETGSPVYRVPMRARQPISAQGCSGRR